MVCLRRNPLRALILCCALPVLFVASAQDQPPTPIRSSPIVEQPAKRAAAEGTVKAPAKVRPEDFGEVVAIPKSSGARTETPARRALLEELVRAAIRYEDEHRRYWMRYRVVVEPQSKEEEGFLDALGHPPGKRHEFECEAARWDEWTWHRLMTYHRDGTRITDPTPPSLLPEFTAKRRPSAAVPLSGAFLSGSTPTLAELWSTQPERITLARWEGEAAVLHFQESQSEPQRTSELTMTPIREGLWLPTRHRVFSDNTKNETRPGSARGFVQEWEVDQVRTFRDDRTPRIESGVVRLMRTQSGGSVGFTMRFQVEAAEYGDDVSLGDHGWTVPGEGHSSHAAAASGQSAATVKVFTLRNTRAADTATIIEQLFQTGPGSPAIHVAADERTNSLIVRGDGDQLAIIEALLLRLDDSSAATQPTAGSDTRESHGPTRNPKEPEDRGVASNEPGILRLQIETTGPGASELRRQYAALEQQTRSLSLRLRGPLPDPATAETLKSRLQDAVRQSFETRQKLQRAELAEFARRLQSIQQSIDSRDRISQQIIDRRIQELLDPHLTWDEPTADTGAGKVLPPGQRVPAMTGPPHKTLSRVELVAVMASWCQPCQEMEPVLQQLEKLGYAVFRSDITNQPEVARQHRVDRIPTFILLADDREVERFTGLTGRDQLQRALDHALTNLDVPSSGRSTDFSGSTAALQIRKQVQPKEQHQQADSTGRSGLSATAMPSTTERLRQTAESIRNLSVTTDYTKRQRFLLPFDSLIEMKLTTTAMIDSIGRSRVDTTGQQLNIEPEGKSVRTWNGRWVGTYNDGVARSLTYHEGNLSSASIDSALSWHGIDPREFTTHFQQTAVTEILERQGTEVAERTEWDGRPVTIVETSPRGDGEEQRRYRFWIDTERGIVVRRAITVRFKEGQPWQEYARIEGREHREIAPGIWLPMKVKYESLDVTPDLTPEKLSWSYEGTNRDWQVNTDLPADTFELQFPPGAQVNDHRPQLLLAPQAAPQFGPSAVEQGPPPWLKTYRFRKDGFTFVRLRYGSADGPQARWATDYPDADINFSQRLAELTSLNVAKDGLALEMTDPALREHAFAYLSGNGLWQVTDVQAAALRTWLEGGGFLMIDDSWGKKELANAVTQLQKILPQRKLEELPPEHPLFHHVFDFKEKPQVCGIAYARQESDQLITWQTDDGKDVSYQAITDSEGRIMVLLCHNTDLADGWERCHDDPWYGREFSEKRAFPMGVNIIFHVLHHTGAH